MRGYKKIAVFFLLALSSTEAFSNGFIITCVTDDNTITIPTVDSAVYNYDLTWVNLSNPGTNEGALSGQTSNVTIGGLSNQDTYQVEISGIFPHIRCGSDLSQKIRTVEQWGDQAWSSFESAFLSCSLLQVNATDTPNLSVVEDMRSMFSGCHELTGNASMNNWNMENVTNVSSMFADAEHFNQDIGNWNTSNVATMSRMFFNANIFNQDIGNWNTGKVKDMSHMFRHANAFNQDIGNWNTSMVEDMSAMFNLAVLFNQDITSWNTGSVTDMGHMFHRAHAFNQDISSWNTSNVIDMGGMFGVARSFNQDLNNWNTSKVTDMDGMFDSADNFNGQIGNWDTKNVTSMALMFRDATSFNQDIGSWNTENVTEMNGMFLHATSFNQDIGDWETGEVLLWDELFMHAHAFDQDLGRWTLATSSDKHRMFAYSGMSCGNYSATLIGWSNNVETANDISLEYQWGMWYGQNAESARDYLINTKGWTFSGDSLTQGICSTGNSNGMFSSNKVHFSAYPNPTEGEINLVLQNVQNTISIVVSNARGEIVKEYSIQNTGTKNITLNLPPGSYFVKATAENFSKAVKVISI